MCTPTQRHARLTACWARLCIFFSPCCWCCFLYGGEQGRYDLHDASMSGEVEKVKAILEAAPDRVNARGPKNVS